MSRRPAVTLIEALMAIFVMAIGLLALLTLFPLGAVQMAVSLKDERCAQASLVGTAQWKTFDLGNDPNINNPLFENPGMGLPALTDGFVPTYPVFVDPMGWNAMQPAPPNVGGMGVGIRRTTVSGAMRLNPQRWFTLGDDITFADNGTPDMSAGNVQREGRYSWAYLARRQMARVPAPAPTPGILPNPAIDLTVVVYGGRLPGVDLSGNPLGETAYANATFAGPGTRTIDIDYGSTNQARPNLRRGSWVLDARMWPDPTQPLSTSTLNVPQGYFYRVVNVTDVSPTVMEIEVQRPISGALRGPFGTGPLVVMENVSEVFEKGTDY
jgi:hypothetical protein